MEASTEPYFRAYLSSPPFAFQYSNYGFNRIFSVVKYSFNIFVSQYSLHSNVFVEVMGILLHNGTALKVIWNFSSAFFCDTLRFVLVEDGVTMASSFLHLE